MDEIWGPDTETDTHTLEVHISRLREKFKENPDFEIVTAVSYTHLDVYKRQELEHTVFCLDKYGNYKYTLSEIQEKELRETNPNISTVLKDGKKIYESIYFKN